MRLMRSKRYHRKKSKIPILGLLIITLIVLLLLVKIIEKPNQNTTDNKVISQPKNSEVIRKKKNKTKNKTTNKKSKFKMNNNHAISESNLKTIKLGENGDTQKEVEKMFGKTDIISTRIIYGTEVSQLTWKNVVGTSANGSITVGFSNGHAIDKGISRLIIKRQKRLKKNDFDSIKNGMTKNEVTKLIGKPNGYTESLIDNKKTEMLSYSSELSGYSDPQFQIILKNERVDIIKPLD